MKCHHRIALALAALQFSMHAVAHGGGLDANGCHTNRKTGDYHCHRAPSRPLPAQPDKEKPGKAELTAQRASEAETALPSTPHCYTGPRGGTYTLTKGGKKNYGGC